MGIATRTDAYFSVGPVFLTAAAILGADGAPLVHILTRAKKNIVAYRPAPRKDPHIPGRQALYGKKLKLYDLFERWHDRFVTATASSNLPATLTTLAAIEKCVNVHLLVLGGLQLLAMHFPQQTIHTAHCWMRTLPKSIPSEFIVKTALTAMLRYNDRDFAQSPIRRYIRPHQQNPNPVEEQRRAS